MPGGLQFILILPDGSKSLIPAEWTDFKTEPAPQHPALIGSLGDWLQLRKLVACRRVTDTTVGAPNSSAYRQDDPTE
jgi:hypothetical protein